MSYLVCLTLLIIIIVLILVNLWKSETPTIESFTRQFFNQIIPTTFIGLDSEQLAGNEFKLTNKLINLLPYNLTVSLVPQNLSRYELLNRNRLQFILARAHELHSLIYRTTPLFSHVAWDHIRFVCSLHSQPINILTNALSITEFGDLRQSGLTVNVGPRESSDYLMAQDLFLQYQLRVGVDINLTYYEPNQVIKEYGHTVQVVIFNLSHPDQYIVTLTNQCPSRLVEIKQLNDGDIFHISLAERPFYQEHPYYQKVLIDKTQLAQFYPNLLLTEQQFAREVEHPIVIQQSLFIRTLSLRYHLLSNDQTDPFLITQLLYFLKLNLFDLNRLPFITNALNSASLADIRLPIEPHEGAREFYTKSGLYTNLASPQCIYINGVCTTDQLINHHLEIE